MRLDKLAVTAQEAFQAAMGIASDADTSSVEPIHLLKALLDAGENNISAIIKRVGADPTMLSGEVDQGHRQWTQGHRRRDGHAPSVARPHERH